MNLPEESWNELNKLYVEWNAKKQERLKEQNKMRLKYVDFLSDEWQGHMFNCETMDGTKYENVIFKLDGNKTILLKPDQNLPELVLKQVQESLLKRISR